MTIPRSAPAAGSSGHAHLELFAGAAVAATVAITATAAINLADDTVVMHGTVTNPVDGAAQQATSIALHAVAYADAIDRGVTGFARVWMIHHRHGGLRLGTAAGRRRRDVRPRAQALS